MDDTVSGASGMKRCSMRFNPSSRDLSIDILKETGNSVLTQPKAQSTFPIAWDSVFK
jgi:hypothetical protein